VAQALDQERERLLVASRLERRDVLPLAFEAPHLHRLQGAQRGIFVIRHGSPPRDSTPDAATNRARPRSRKRARSLPCPGPRALGQAGRLRAPPPDRLSKAPPRTAWTRDPRRTGKARRAGPRDRAPDPPSSPRPRTREPGCARCGAGTRAPAPFPRAPLR